MSRRYLSVALVLLSLAAVGCGQPPVSLSPVLLRVSGSTSMQGLIARLAAAYSEQHPHVAFEFSAVGSAAGMEDLRRGDADLALVSRELDHQEEYDVLTEKRTLAYTVVAQDGIAAVVNEDNPVGALTMYQLRNIFEGQTTNWEQLGVAAEEIVVISREDGSGTRRAFEEQVMRGGHVTSTALIMPSSKALHDYVAQSVGAIGYLSLGYPRSGVVPLMIDDVRPERLAVEQGTYPIIRPFLLVSRADPEPEVASFMQYARSLPAQAIVRQTHGGARNSAVR